MRIVDNNKIV